MNNFLILVGLGHIELAVSHLVFRIVIIRLGDLFVIELIHDIQGERNWITYLKSCKLYIKVFLSVFSARKCLSEYQFGHSS